MLLPNKLPQTNSSDVETKVRDVEKIETESSREDRKNTEKLIKSILSLNKQLKDVEKKGSRIGGRSTIGDLITGAKSTISKFTSASGLVGHMADSTKNPLLSAMLGSAANRLDSKAEKKRAEKNFVTAVATGTTKGRELIDQKGLQEGLKELRKMFVERSKLENEIAIAKEKRRVVKEAGKDAGLETDVDEKSLKQLEALEKRLEAMTLALDPDKKKPEKNDQNPPEPVKKESSIPEDATPAKESSDHKKRVNDLIDGVREGMAAAFEELSPEDKKLIQAANPDMMKGMSDSIFKDLSTISEEQLDELIRIADILDGSKEAELESRIKDTKPAAKAETEKKEEGLIGKMIKGTSEMFKGPLGKLTGLLGSVPGMLLKGITPLVSMLGGLTSMAGGAAAVGAAGAAGWYAGGKINEFVEENTSSSIGGHVYEGVQWMKGAIGMESDEEKIKNAEIKAAKESLDKNGKISEQNAKLLRDAGIEVSEKQIIRPNAQTVRRLDNQQAEVIATPVVQAAEIEKSEVTVRERAVRVIDAEIDRQEKESVAKKSEVVSVVNAPQTVNNNSTTQNIVRPQIRNPEPSYMKVESMRFVW